jgi:hypothetical protein
MLLDQAGGTIRADVDLPYWGGVNGWIDAPTGTIVDCVYLDVGWTNGYMDRLLEAHVPGLGYTTAFCRTVSQSRILHDPAGWLGALQARSRPPYPESLRRNIIAHNHPVLRTILSSYLSQVESAVRRGDVVSINHRVASLLASYFDIVFALNRVLHPGEKRQMAFAQRECTVLPTEMDVDVTAVLTAAGGTSDAVLTHLGRLLDRLDAVLKAAGFDPETLEPWRNPSP